MTDVKSILINNLPKKRWLNHLLFWLLILGILTFTITIPYGYYYTTFVRNSIMLIPQILASYFLVYYQVPNLLYQKKYGYFLISFLISSYLLSALARFIVVHIIEELYRQPPFSQESVLEILKSPRKLFGHYFFNIYTPAIIMFIIKLIKEKFKEDSKRELLEKEKISAELSFLKAQIHPHFLFNTLNNLYVLTRQKSDKASEMILKLSEILDYILYQCNESKVTIEKEMVLIQNYMDLEQLRYGNRLNITFNRNIDNPKTRIAPLILISLIENAFKHGASGLIEEPKIKIDVIVNDAQLQFSVYNTKVKHEQYDSTAYKKGIGMKNTKLQLQLLYPDKHTLEVIEEDLSYQVQLRIDLNI